MTHSHEGRSTVAATPVLVSTLDKTDETNGAVINGAIAYEEAVGLAHQMENYGLHIAEIAHAQRVLSREETRIKDGIKAKYGERKIGEDDNEFYISVVAQRDKQIALDIAANERLEDIAEQHIHNARMQDDYESHLGGLKALHAAAVARVRQCGSVAEYAAACLNLKAAKIAGKKKIKIFN